VNLKREKEVGETDKFEKKKWVKLTNSLTSKTFSPAFNKNGTNSPTHFHNVDKLTHYSSISPTPEGVFGDGTKSEVLEPKNPMSSHVLRKKNSVHNESRLLAVVSVNLESNDARMDSEWLRCAERPRLV